MESTLWYWRKRAPNLPDLVDTQTSHRHGRDLVPWTGRDGFECVKDIYEVRGRSCHWCTLLAAHAFQAKFGSPVNFLRFSDGALDFVRKNPYQLVLNYSILRQDWISAMLLITVSLHLFSYFWQYGVLLLYLLTVWVITTLGPFINLPLMSKNITVTELG